MCTVSYVPLSEGRFVFTSNRDEAPARNAVQIVEEQGAYRTIVYPQDKGAQGSWIIVDDRGHFVCILNGAFEKHERKLPYKMSRGVMAKIYFDYTDTEAFLTSFDFEGMEAFTCIIYDGDLLEIRWDGERLHQSPKDLNQRHIWSSCTLYPPAWVDQRKAWFKMHFENKIKISQADVLDFHHHGGVGDSSYDIVMNRNEVVRTISISSILVDGDQIHFEYEDLLNQKVQRRHIEKSVHGFS